MKNLLFLSICFLALSCSKESENPALELTDLEKFEQNYKGSIWKYSQSMEWYLRNKSSGVVETIELETLLFIRLDFSKTSNRFSSSSTIGIDIGSYLEDYEITDTNNYSIVDGNYLFCWDDHEPFDFESYVSSSHELTLSALADNILVTKIIKDNVETTIIYTVNTNNNTITREFGTKTTFTRVDSNTYCD